jgi:hypothetical protein
MGRGEEQRQTTRKLVKIKIDGTDGNLWEQVTKLRAEVEGEGIGQVAMHQLRCVDAKKMTKLVQVAFRSSTVKVNIHVPIDSRQEKKPQRKEMKTYALVVEKKGMQFRDILDKVKTVIKSDPSKEAVQTIRSTRDGKLLITMEKNSEKMGRLEEALKRVDGNLAVKKAGSNDGMETVHVRGLDATTGKEEVVAILEEKLGAGKNWRVSDLRPCRNNTHAATIVMRKQDADNILAEGSLRIGAVRCGVERRIATERCYRCWSFDHKAANCDGPDRSKTCYRCGVEGHEARDCGNEEACPLCQKAGHKAEGRGCGVFRSALNKARKATNEKETRTLRKFGCPAQYKEGQVRSGPPPRSRETLSFVEGLK